MATRFETGQERGKGGSRLRGVSLDYYPHRRAQLGPDHVLDHDVAVVDSATAEVGDQQLMSNLFSHAPWAWTPWEV